MSRPPVVNIIQRSLLAMFVFALFAASFGTSPVIAQKKESKSKQAKSQPAKAESSTATAEPSPSPKDEGADEAKGPWHGLTWRLVGPYRG